MTLFLRICINSSIRQFNYSRHRHANTIYRVPTNLLFSRRDRTDLKSHCFGSIDCIPITYTIFNTHSSPKETIHILPAHCQFVFPIIKTNGVNFLYANTHTKKKGGSHSGGVTYFGCTRRSTRSDRVLNLGRSACLVCPMYNADTPRTHSYNRTLVLASPAHHRRKQRRRRETHPIPLRSPNSALSRETWMSASLVSVTQILAWLGLGCTKTILSVLEESAFHFALLCVCFLILLFYWCLWKEMERGHKKGH